MKLLNYILGLLVLFAIVGTLSGLKSRSSLKSNSLITANEKTDEKALEYSMADDDDDEDDEDDEDAELEDQLDDEDE
jgi:UPF0716 family protein affecting phage T7 exclusion